MTFETTPLPTAPLQASSQTSAAENPAVSAPPRAGKQSWYRWLATSQAPLPKFVRKLRWRIVMVTLPAPRMIAVPMRWTYVALSGAYNFLFRIFICEPIFKASCKKYGHKLRTDCLIHSIRGKGDIILGDNVWLDGKSSIAFGARFSDRPTFEIGDNSGVAHNCRFVIAKRITIGRNTTISGNVTVMDSNGHQTDPRARTEHLAPKDEEIRPVAIGDNVWIGMHCIVFPGVRIGDGSVVSAGSVVRNHVPPYSVVAGNPARVMFRLKKNAASAPGTTAT